MRGWRGWAAPIAVMWMVAACGTRSSAYSTGVRHARYEGPVALVAVPGRLGVEAAQVGVVEVTSVESLETAASAFRERVGEVGGNVGVVDRIWMTFQMEQRSQLVSYSCGTTTAPQTCTRTQITYEEVGYLHMVGRAFMSGGMR